jgi:hypothetical protein
VAKISKINIAITGDAKGLAAATDAATRDLRRLNAAAAVSSKRLVEMKGRTNQVSESLGKLGVQSRGLNFASGILGLSSMGGAGLAMGAAGLGLAGAGIAAGVGVNAVQGIPDLRKRAREALEETRMDGRRRIEEFGLTQRLAEGLAANGAGPSVAQQLGFTGGLSAGMGSVQGSPGANLANLAIQSGPGALGIFAGQKMMGASTNAAALTAGEAMLGSGATGVQGAINAYGDLMNAGGVVGFMRDMAMWWSK